jgi:hypothetical protein
MQKVITTKNISTQYVTEVFCLFVFLQLADLILISIGVYRFGIEIEANPLIRNLMGHVGVLPSLASVKLISIFSGYVAYALASETLSARYALFISTITVAVFAVIPWTFILILTSGLF